MASKRNGARKFSVGSLIMGILSILAGVFFIFYTLRYTPIPESKALSYSGQFDRVENEGDYCEIYMTDGSYHSVFWETTEQEMLDRIASIGKGTPIEVKVNPNSSYVAELTVDGEILLPFAQTQEEIRSYCNWYAGLGIVACVTGVLLILLEAVMSSARKKEKVKQKRQRCASDGNSVVLRRADRSVKGKILLEAQAMGHSILYRRVKITNELVIDGNVYDERKGILEFDHQLTAHLDGHTFSAGLTGETSFLAVDGEWIKDKRRLI